MRWLAPLALACALFALAAPARAEPVRILVAVGHAAGLPGEASLHHARDDAKSVRDVFVELGGVRPENAFLLEEPSREAFYAALDRARAAAARHRPQEVTLLLYFSGHGDREALHFGPALVSTSDVAARIGAVRAALKIVVFDACRTVREKGVSADAPFAISLDAPPSATGAVWLHASADGEAAQESDDLGGAIFTHFWIDGLRGAADANGDHQVSLSESYDFAYHQTLFRSSKSSGALQRPAASSSLSESSPVILTRTSRTTSLLRFPAAADAYYLVFAKGSHTVAGEAWGDPRRPVEIALPAGRYIVEQRLSGGAGATELSLGGGEQRDLAPSDFRSFDAELLAQKGGELVVFPNELELAWGAASGGLYDFGQALSARYARRFGAWALSLGADAGLGKDTFATGESHLLFAGLDGWIERRLHLGPIELRLALGPAARYVVQKVRYADAARLTLAGYAGEQTHRALAWGGDGAFGLALAISSRVDLFTEVRGGVLVARADGSARPYGELGGRLGARLLF